MDNAEIIGAFVMLATEELSVKQVLGYLVNINSWAISIINFAGVSQRICESSTDCNRNGNCVNDQQGGSNCQCFRGYRGSRCETRQ